MSRRTLWTALSCAAALIPSLATAQTDDREALVRAAEDAAAAADQAVDDARRALALAETAARSARKAASAARAIVGGPARPDAATQVAAARPPGTGPAPATALDPNENMAVARPGDDTGAGVQPATPPDRQRASTALSGSIANGPNSGFLKSSIAPDLQVIASDKDKVASIAWTVDVSGGSRGGKLTADQFTLTASGKFDGESDTSLLGLKGFPNGTEVKLKYIHYWGRTNLSGVEKDPVAVARANCLDETGSAALCNPYADPGVGAFMARWNRNGYRDLLAEVFPESVKFAGIEFAGNQAGYKYLDRGAFAFRKESRFGYGGSAFVGMLFDQGLTSLTTGYTWRRQFKEATAIQLCQPVAGTIQTQCLSGADGAPTRDNASLVTVELRRALARLPGQFATLAVAPEFSFDTGTAAWSLGLPLYFAGDGSGKLRGGIRAEYVNQRNNKGKREDDLLLGLFVGVPFSLFAY